MNKMTNNKAKTQAIKPSPISGTLPPEERQFGKPNGNKQGRGFWKKESTARFILEKMMKMTKTELEEVFKDEDAPLFERKLAQCIFKGEWKEIEAMINQVYGTPKQITEVKVENPTPLIDLTKMKSNGKDDGAH